VSQSVYGRIMNYRKGIRTQKANECLIKFENPETEILGKKVVWKEGNSKLSGKIIGFHGKNGVVIAKFKKGVPGQAIGTKVELIT
jgi:large subunit ribosomal protein L35Ae